jgi:bifunctional DNase/RNase
MPTAVQHEFLDIRVADVRRVRDSARDHIVLLAEPDGPRRLPIWIGRLIAVRLLGAQLARP